MKIAILPSARQKPCGKGTPDGIPRRIAWPMTVRGHPLTVSQQRSVSPRQWARGTSSAFCYLAGLARNTTWARPPSSWKRIPRPASRRRLNARARPLTRSSSMPSLARSSDRSPTKSSSVMPTNAGPSCGRPASWLHSTRRVCTSRPGHRAGALPPLGTHAGRLTLVGVPSRTECGADVLRGPNASQALRQRLRSTHRRHTKRRNRCRKADGGPGGLDSSYRGADRIGADTGSAT